MSGGKFKAQRINASIQAGVDQAVRETKAAQEAERQERVAEYRAREAARRIFVFEDLKDALIIRAYSQWLEVVRVNAKTVTVRDSNGLHCRVPHKDVTAFGNRLSHIIFGHTPPRVAS